MSGFNHEHAVNCPVYLNDVVILNKQTRVVYSFIPERVFGKRISVLSFIFCMYITVKCLQDDYFQTVEDYVGNDSKDSQIYIATIQTIPLKNKIARSN